MDPRDLGPVGFSVQHDAPPSVTLPPLRIVVVGDFSRDNQQRVAGPLSADKDNIAATLSKLSAALQLAVPNRLAAKPDTLHVRINVQQIQDFAPRSVAGQLEDLRLLSDLVGQLNSCAAGRADTVSLQPFLARCSGFDALAGPLAEVSGALSPPAKTTAAKVAQPTPSSAPRHAKDDALDRILGMVATTAEEAEKPPERVMANAAMDDLIGAVLSGPAGPPPAARAAMRRAATQIEELIARQVDEVVHLPEFLRLEGSWRGLDLLMRAVKPRKGGRLELLDLAKEELLDGFDRQVVQPELTGATDASVTLVLADYAFDNTGADLALIAGLGEAAEQLQAPLLVGLDLGFFELSAGADNRQRAYLGNLLEEPQYTKFNALRDKDSARWLAACVNRLLLRDPYEAGSRRGLRLAERVDGDDQRVWGNAAWAVACAVARSHARFGWPTEITGNDDGMLDELPIRPAPDRSGRPVHLGTEAFLSQELSGDLARAGMVALCAPMESDRAVIYAAPMLHRPEHSSSASRRQKARQMDSLPYQLLAGRVADLLGRNRASVVSGKSPSDAGRALEQFLLGVVAGTGQGAGAGVQLVSGGDGTRLAQLTLRTGHRVMGGIQMSFAVPL